MLKIAILFLSFLDENHIKREVDGKRNCINTIIMKPMTKTSQHNDIAPMMYHGGCPVLKKYQFLFFYHYFDENHMKDMEIKKKLYYY